MQYSSKSTVRETLEVDMAQLGDSSTVIPKYIKSAPTPL
jgi:hypothetical protein